MSLEGAQNEMRRLIAWSFTHFEKSSSFDYSAVRVQTSAPSSAPIPVPNQTLEQTRIVRVLRTMSPEQAAWLRFSYAARDALSEWDDLSLVGCHVFEKCLADCTELTEQKKQRLMGFVLPALQHVRKGVNTGRKLYTVKQLIDLTQNSAGATENCWKRDFAPFWKALNGALINLDHLALLNAVCANEVASETANTQNRVYVNAQMRLSA